MIKRIYKYNELPIQVQLAGRLRRIGNIVPHEWSSFIVHKNGKPDLIGMMLLADLIYKFTPIPSHDADGNFDGGYTKPFSDTHEMYRTSAAELGKKWNFSKNQVLDALKRLSDKKIIKRVIVVRETIAGIYCTNVMYLHPIIPNIDALMYPVSAKNRVPDMPVTHTDTPDTHTDTPDTHTDTPDTLPDTPGTPPGISGTPTDKTGTYTITNTTTNPITNPSNKKIPKSPASGAIKEESNEVIIFESWKEQTGNRGAKLDQERRKLIADRLKDGYSVDVLCSAISGNMSSPWHQGSNDTGATFNSIGLIFRDAAHVDRFTGFARNPPRPRNKAELALEASIRAGQDFINDDSISIDNVKPLSILGVGMRRLRD